MPIAIVAMAVYGTQNMKARLMLIASRAEASMSIAEVVLIAQLIAACCITVNNLHELGKRKGWW
jgi:uncharacterized membrane protein YhaH (DUF805 family)